MLQRDVRFKLAGESRNDESVYFKPQPREVANQPDVQYGKNRSQDDCKDLPYQERNSIS